MQKKYIIIVALKSKHKMLTHRKKCPYGMRMVLILFVWYCLLLCVINTQCEKCSLHTSVDVWIDVEWYEAGVEMAVTVDIKEKYWIFWTFF